MCRCRLLDSSSCSRLGNQREGGEDRGVERTGRASNRLGMYRCEATIIGPSRRSSRKCASSRGAVSSPRPSRAPRGTGMLRSFSISMTLAAGLLSASAAMAEVKVAALIGDHMVVQQSRPVHLWGTASAGESVHGSLAGVEGETRADATGKWSLNLPALPVGGPHTLTLRGTNTLTFSDVWSGRSGWHRGNRTWSSRSPDQAERPRRCPGCRVSASSR